MKTYDVPVLETSRLILRELRPGDYPEIFAIFSDRETTRYYDVPTMRKWSSAQKLLEWWRKRINRRKALRWGITMNLEGDKVIGTCGFSELDLVAQKGEIGLDIVRSHWHQGIMKEAVRAVIQFGFKEMGLNLIETWVMEENQYSIAGIKSLGFTHLGKAGQVYWRGKMHNKEYFILKREDYFNNPR